MCSVPCECHFGGIEDGADAGGAHRTRRRVEWQRCSGGLLDSDSESAKHGGVLDSECTKRGVEVNWILEVRNVVRRCVGFGKYKT